MYPALLYLVSIYTAVPVFRLLAPGAGAFGASGAIAGVMEAYAVIFGWRKIDFFYSLAFYFDYLRALAIVLLPLWLGNELYQFLTEQGAQVAYMAHFGGLLGGAAMGVLCRWRWPLQIRNHHETQEARESDDQAFQRGMGHLGALEFRKGLALFKALQKNIHKTCNRRAWCTGRPGPSRPATTATGPRSCCSRWRKAITGNDARTSSSFCWTLCCANSRNRTRRQPQPK